MAFVSGFKHDLFVSYAHLDNMPVGSRAEGWVDALVRNVQSEVWQRLGTKEFCIWTDHRLDGNRPLTPDILEGIRSSALLLVVLSPSYLRSEWCRRERDHFLSLVNERVATGCVFVVHAREVERSEIPREFGDLLGYPFWIRESDSAPDRPLLVDPPEAKSVSRIVELSHSIKKQVIGLNRRAASRPAPGPSVFVARGTEDLEDREEELRSYLSQAGINILPQHWYQHTDEAAFRQAMLEDMRCCKVFAQLLSTSRGRELPFPSSPRLPRMQLDTAEQAGIPVLQWRDRGVDLAAVADLGHRALLERARASGIEEFKRTVMEETRRIVPTERKTAPNVMVFVNADSPDRALAEEVGKTLGQQFGVECYWPLEAGTPEEVRSDLEDNLKTCDGLLLIYGSAGAMWVRRQLKEGRKILSQRDRALAALGIFEGPPPESKGDLGATIPNLLTLNCRGGIDQAVLKQFVDNLRK